MKRNDEPNTLGLDNVRVLGHDITVKFNKDMISEDGKFAHFNIVKNELVIDSDVCWQQALSAVLHEVLESLDSGLALELDHDGQLMKLEAGLFQVLSDNPKFLSLFTDEWEYDDDED